MRMLSIILDSLNDFDVVSVFIFQYRIDGMDVQNQCPLPKERLVFGIFTRGELQWGKRLRLIIHTSKLIITLIEMVNGMLSYRSV